MQHSSRNISSLLRNPHEIPDPDLAVEIQEVKAGLRKASMGQTLSRPLALIINCNHLLLFQHVTVCLQVIIPLTVSTFCLVTYLTY